MSSDLGTEDKASTILEVINKSLLDKPIYRILPAMGLSKSAKKAFRKSERERWQRLNRVSNTSVIYYTAV
jgi:hypothetical protein